MSDTSKPLWLGSRSCQGHILKLNFLQHQGRRKKSFITWHQVSKPSEVPAKSSAASTSFSEVNVDQRPAEVTIRWRFNKPFLSFSYWGKCYKRFLSRIYYYTWYFKDPLIFNEKRLLVPKYSGAASLEVLCPLHFWIRFSDQIRLFCTVYKLPF